MDYAFLYSTTLLVSFALTFILLLYHRRYWDQATHRPLQAIYFLNMTSALMCVIWVFVDGLPRWIPVNYLANIIEFNCMGYCGYAWLRYCLGFVDIPALKTRRAKLLLFAPIGVVTALILTTPLTHWAFFIDEGGFFRRGTYYFMQQTGYLYLCVSSAICLLYRKRCTTSGQRRRMNVLAMFPLSPAFFGGIQIVAPSGLAPTLQFSVLVSLILVFVDELDQKITRDSLTQLKNRYEFERILQSRMNSAQPDGLWAIMADLDDFKSINDNYGHQQGDAALKTVARVLAETAAAHHADCARMSGDEFLALLETDAPEAAEAFRRELEENLAAACAGLPYTLHISVGAAQYDGRMTMMELLNRADQAMYAEKQRRKREGKRTGR